MNMDHGPSCFCKTCSMGQTISQDGSPLKSPALHYSDKQTQKATDLSSEVATSEGDFQFDRIAQSSATSETHFNRNNENLNTPQHTSCPTCAPQFQQTYLQICPTANYPSVMGKIVCHHDPSTAYPFVAAPVARRVQTNSSIPHQWFTCESQHTLETSSGSNSTTSEQMPIRLILNIKTVANKTPNQAEPIVIPWSPTRPERLQPNCVNDDEPLATFNSPTTPNDDEYYSCCSASSESDAIADPCNKCSFNDESLFGGCKQPNRKKETVLELLHTVIHLMTNDDTPVMYGHPPVIPCEENSQKVTVPTSQLNAPAGGEMFNKCKVPCRIRGSDSRNPLCALQVPINDFNDEYKICCPCAEVQTPSTGGFQANLDKLETDIPFELVDDRNFIVSATANQPMEEEGYGGTNEKEPIQNQFAPTPWHYYFYCMAALASLEGLNMPDPVVSGHYARMPSAFEPVGDFSLLKEESKEHQGVDKMDADVPHIEPNDNMPIKPIEASAEQFYQLNEVFEDEAPNHTKEMLSSNRNKGTKSVIEIDFIEEEQHPHMLGLEQFDKVQNYRTYPNHLPLDIAEFPYCNDSQSAYAQLRGNQFPNSFSAKGDKNNRHDFIENFYEAPQEEPELEKETRAERQKNRSHKDPGKCCHSYTTPQSSENKCSPIATTQQVASRVDEFKYFVDSIIMDLEAMEHARRKCEALKQLCVPRPGVCCRKSFPVTITDVEDLGATSLYVKWTIHDCHGIEGYEIFVDGHLTNRFYHSGHTAGVVTNVDVNIPHKVALVAQPANMQDNSLEMLCNLSKTRNKSKSLPWKTEATKDQNSSHEACSSQWTASIYLYDPGQRKTLTALPVKNDNV